MDKKYYWNVTTFQKHFTETLSIKFTDIGEEFVEAKML